ncbi:hypothetical protein FRC08_007863 [Ceratobasidium sp. 394]|nr:hypothetical protein FRC08_007863 [Ceratobasidium sp. 394]
MELAADAATLDDLPRPLTVRNHLIIEAYRVTKFVPRVFQVDFALAVDAGRDVVCVACTGSGKSLAFVLIHFLRPDFIIWIISPLNVIEHQMAANYNKYGIPSVAVNASTLNPTLLKDIESSKYKVVISSPECYKDNNKLKRAVLSEKLAKKRHITIVDEAHAIWAWGASGFRKDFERIGDMRALMPDPNSPMCAATATLSSQVKDTVVRSLQIRPGHLSINLGNWRPNLCYGLRVMSGGQRSYSEVRQFFDSRKNVMDIPQALVFVENYEAARHIAEELRNHFGLIGVEGSLAIPYYHSIIDEETKRCTEQRFREGKARIMVTTEALTMGADFPSVELILNFLSPMLAEIWLQRSGRGARNEGIICLCLILVTKGIVKKAAKICKDAGVEIDPLLQKIKVEEEDNVLEAEEEATDLPGAPAGRLGKHVMSIEMAEYVATGAAGGCLTEVADRIFKNPAHTSCLEVGGCESCVKQRQEQEPDAHQDRRWNIRQQVELADDLEDEKLTHKIPDKPSIRPMAERKRLADILADWRRKKLQDLVGVHTISLNQIMTPKGLERISKVKGITDISDFDKPEIKWPGRESWRREVLVLVSDQQRIEDRRIAEVEEEARAKAEARERKKEEAARKKEETARKKEENARKKEAAHTKETASRAAVLTPAGPSTGGPAFYGSFSLQTPAQLPRIQPYAPSLPSPVTPSATARASFSQPARSVGRLVINPQPRSTAEQYLPTPITPNTPAFSIPNYNASSSTSTSTSYPTLASAFPSLASGPSSLTPLSSQPRSLSAVSLWFSRQTSN